MLNDLLLKNINNELDQINNKIEQIDEKFIYSTNEQTIGKWIDGKPLYRKVFVITNYDSQGNENYLSIDSSIDNMTYLYGYVKARELYPSQYANPLASGQQFFYLKYNVWDRTLSYITGASSAGGTIYIIMEYTKSTD